MLPLTVAEQAALNRHLLILAELRRIMVEMTRVLEMLEAPESSPDHGQGEGQ